ncbi:MAG: CCA tRNA nucleotidyltransferase [Candidatus Micrarchaeota archaeon]
MSEKGCESIFATVSRKITPSAQEAREEKKFAAWAIRQLARNLPKGAKVNFVGSAARDTGIRGDRDIDLFIAFPKKYSRDEIVEQTKRAAKAVHSDWQMHYAEHPYLQAVVKGFKVEVIPCYKFSPNEPLASAVDRTPLHALYLQKRLSTRQKSGVRVLKALLKSAGIYGAESEVEGFSGLVCEYLVLNYRSLYGLLAAASKWQPPVVLDIENAYDEDQAALKAKFASPLVLVDFVDKNRNAAAAISAESAAKFILLSRAFLSKPSLTFFAPRRNSCSNAQIAAAAKSRMDFVALEFRKPPGVVSDILVPQLRRTLRSLARHLELYGLRVFDSASACSEDSCVLLFELDGLNAPKVVRRNGPPAWMARDAAKFIALHSHALRGPYVSADRLVSEEPCSRDAQGFFQGVRENPSRYGVASHFAAPVASSRFSCGASVLKRAEGDKLLSQCLCDYLFRKEAFL